MSIATANHRRRLVKGQCLNKRGETKYVGHPLNVLVVPDCVWKQKQKKDCEVNVNIIKEVFEKKI